MTSKSFTVERDRERDALKAIINYPAAQNKFLRTDGVLRLLMPSVSYIYIFLLTIYYDFY